MKNPFELKGNAIPDKELANKEIAGWLSRETKTEFAGYEVKPTTEERRIIDTVQDLVDEQIREYHGRPHHLPQERIHLFKNDGVAKMTKGSLAKAFCNLKDQFVVLDRSGSSLFLAVAAAHEFFHLKSAKTVRDSGAGPYMDQSGVLLMDSEGKHYLNRLEEAIVSECERQFYQERIKKHPLFKDQVRKVEIVGKWLEKLFKVQRIPEKTRESFLTEMIDVPDDKDLLAYLNSDKTELEKLGYLNAVLQEWISKKKILFTSREKEREWLYGIIDDLKDKFRGRFKDRGDVFKYFARANFQGNVWPIIIMIEELLGEGKFREIFSSDFVAGKSDDNRSVKDSGTV